MPVAYHRDFYGEMTDQLAGGDESDRLLVTWPLDAPHTEVGPETVDDILGAGAQLGIVSDDDGPRAVADLPAGAHVVIPIPRDIETMRRTDPVAASRWRRALRDALSPLFDSEGTALAHRTRFLRSGHYVISPLTG